MKSAVVFRCNAGSRVGQGHLVRCREMARQLTGEGHRCAMLGPPRALRHPDDADLFDRWEHVPERGDSNEDARRVIALCRDMGARHAVMDDYRIDPGYQRVLKEAGLRWLQQFDASAPWDFYADVLVNAGPMERLEHYAPYLKNPEGVVLFGPRYAVLRRAFRRLPVRADGRAVRRILVSFGGGDDMGAVALTLKSLSERVQSGVVLVVVSGPSNPRHEEIATLAAELPEGQVELHIDPPDTPYLLASCDMAVIAGGTMSYEAAICGLPMIFIALAPNQRRTCVGWAELAGAVYLGMVGEVKISDISCAAMRIMGDAAMRRRMAASGRELVDGQGVDRLVSALFGKDLE